MKKLRFVAETTDFYPELKAEVARHFESNQISYKANRHMLVKMIILFAIYILAYASIYWVNGSMIGLFLVYAFLGAWSFLVGLNVAHDAVHNAIFEKRAHNKMLLVIFDLLGTNSYNWKNRHLGSHHAYPNIMNYDSDAQQTNMVKIFPHDKHRFYHAFQHIYMPFLYMFYMLRWVFYRDFKDAASDQIGYFNNKNYPKKELVKLIFFKLFYLFYILILPYLVLDFSIWIMLLAFLIMTVSASMVVMTVLLSSHVGDDTSFPEPDENGLMPHSWSYHQVITTADYGTNSWFYNQLFGGFNHHLIHHFFPHICHVHYPKLTPILREKVAKYNLPYRHKKSLYESMSSHFKLLANNSRQKKGGIQLEELFQDM